MGIGRMTAESRDEMAEKEKARLEMQKEAVKARKAKEKAGSERRTKTRPSPKHRIEKEAVAMRIPITLQ